MIVPDVNLLLYAEIAGYPQHAAARTWWESALSRGERIGLCPPALLGFVRIATSRRIFERPMPVEEATERVGRWLARRGVVALTPSGDHVPAVLRLLTQVGTAGALVTDAEIATYAMSIQGVVYSNDTDFAKFPGLRWKNPLAGSALTGI